MPFKTILSIIGVDQDKADLAAAAELSARASAHLTAVVVGCVPPAPFGYVAGEAYSAWSLDWEAENKRLEDRVAKLQEFLKNKGLQGDIQPLYCLRGVVAEEIARRASYADVSLLGPGLLKDDFLRDRVVDGALFQSPAPVLLAPKDKQVELAPKTVLVAWNAGLQAGKALRQSLEMLLGAESVHVVLVDPQATPYAMGQEPGADIATFLSRHGVKTTVDVIASGGHQVDEALRQHALDINADIIVMGAYGHSKLREWIFGGTTRSIIANPGFPVLLAH